MRILFLFATFAALASAQTPAQIRRAADRALVPIQRSVETFVAKRACVSCHHNSLAILTLRMASTHGLAVRDKVLEDLEQKTFHEFNTPDALEAAVEGVNFADPTPNESFLLMAASAAGLQRSDAIHVYAARLASWQQADGHWSTSDFRPPHSSSLFTATASALIAMNAYGAATEASRSRARQWLISAAPESTEDAAFRLLGLTAAEASSFQLERAAQDLVALQLPNGGWPQLRGYSPDAYSTGEAVYALSQAKQRDPAQHRGLRFLLNTQAADGTWHTKTRMLSPARVSPPYFKTTFPYNRDEFLSFAGSCWALSALLTGFPEQPITQDRIQVSPPTQLQTLQQSALFGSEADLRSELDSRGWNANYKFANDVTLLMLAAASNDAEAKVRLLLSRGADARARTKSGTDALTVAATFRGNSGAIKAILDAGAQPNPPEGSKVKNSALVLSSMSGDLDAVKLLLARGADPSASSRANTPLSAAITFNHPDVVQALIQAGASVDLAESTGINLLHWATITNRPEAIPMLIKAGVHVNDMDENGFTPLHFAASIDFGNTETLDALLTAGADTKLRDFDNRTPQQQALRLGHTRLAARLSRAPKR